MIAADAEPGTAQHQLANEIVQAAVKGRGLAHQLLAFGRGGGSRPEMIPVPDLLTDMQPLFGRTLGEHIACSSPSARTYGRCTPSAARSNRRWSTWRPTPATRCCAAVCCRCQATNVVIVPGRADRAGPGRSPGPPRDHGHRSAAWTTPPGARVGAVLHDPVRRGRAGPDHGGRHRAWHRRAYQSGIPAADGYHRPAPPARGRGAGHAAPRPGRRRHPVSRNVLVVEDQPELAQVVQRLLEPAGYIVTVATDARTAVAEVAAGGQPDLLITDVVMPAITGPELAVVLRAYCPVCRCSTCPATPRRRSARRSNWTATAS